MFLYILCKVCFTYFMLTSCCETLISPRNNSCVSAFTNLGLEEAKLMVLLKEQLVGIECTCLVPASIYRGGVHDPGGQCRVCRIGCKVIARVTWMAGGMGRSRVGVRRCRGGVFR